VPSETIDNSTPSIDRALVAVVAELMEHVATSQSQFSRNEKTGVRTYPIPFFGDLTDAVVATVGLNPSATEFAATRWPNDLTAFELTARLINYFRGDPHPWFRRWEQALSLIGASYSNNAVHLDLSPRATVNAAGVADKVGFDSMLRLDFPWMLRFIDHAPKLRLILMAGAATSRFYMNEYVGRVMPSELGRLEGSLVRQAGRGSVKNHVLVMGGRRIPVFFCSSSPSDRRNPEILGARIAENAAALVDLMRP
jgi:hypothetical protein